MKNLVLDKVSKATFKCDRIGDHLYLKGVNVEGTFQLPYTVEDEFEKISSRKTYKHNGAWPKRLAELLIMASKRKKSTGTVITLRLDNITWRDNARVDMEEEVNKPKPKKKKQTNKAVEDPKPTKLKKEVKIKSGVTTLADICDQLGIKPAAARGKLRGQVEKPAEGWKWSSEEEIQKIIKVLQ